MLILKLRKKPRYKGRGKGFRFNFYPYPFAGGQPVNRKKKKKRENGSEISQRIRPTARNTLPASMESAKSISSIPAIVGH